METVKKMVERFGYLKIIMKSDTEPAILALKEAVRRENDVEIVMEEVPVGDHRANGLVENAVEIVLGQFHVIKDVLESKHERRTGGEHQVAPWMVTHTVSVINRGRTESDGSSVHKRGKGGELNKPAAEFGECTL